MTVVRVARVKTPLTGAPATNPKAEVSATILPSPDTRRFFTLLAQKLTPPATGIALFLALWAVTADLTELPGPGQTFATAIEIFRDPFYDNGPNDRGIGWNLLASLYRVGVGFGMAALVGIPLGFLIGHFGFLHQATVPIISLLRPVSPLAWLPIGLYVFSRAEPAAVWVIFISSLWPMVLNTAAGVMHIPQEYRNVGRVLDLSPWKLFTRILLPAVVPYLITGIRLSVGIAWLVIVAAEMVTGGVGIGFWVWDHWNNLSVQHILIAIFVIGLVGFILEQAILWVARQFNY